MTYILVAEDHPTTQKLLRHKLEKEGFRVRIASDGDEALRMALAERPRLLLLDVNMPGQSGLDVTRVVKAHYSPDAPPVILVTALGMESDVEDGMLAGADDYLIKPFSPQALVERIRAIIGPG